MRNGTGVTTSSVTGQTLGLDGIQEYRVLTNAFPAEYGGVVGSQTVMVSKAVDESVPRLGLSVSQGPRPRSGQLL